MRVCLVSRELAPFYHGGIGTYIAQFAKALAACGHEVHVLTEPHDGLHERSPSLLPGVRVHAVNVNEGACQVGAYPAYPMRHAMAVYESLKHLHRKYRFDYIETPDYWGEGYFVLRDKKTLGTFDDCVVSARLHSPAYLCREFDRQHWISTEVALADHMERTVVQEADVLLSPSHAMFQATQRLLGERMPPEDGPRAVPRYVVPLPMDISAIQHELGVGHPTGQAGTKTILLFGRMQYLKGVHLLVEAGHRLLARGFDINIRIIGGDTPTAPFGKSMREWIEKKVQGVWRDRFILEDRRPRTELAAAIHHATLCCFPSLFESFSMVCVEAMAAGSPVVASDFGGTGEIIQDGVNGLHFECGNVDSLERVLARALSDADLRDRIAAAAPRRVAELCDPRRVVEQTLAAVSEVADRRRIPVVSLPAPATPPAALPAAPAPARAADTSLVRVGPTRAEGEPLISVVIPFYNMGRWLPETLQSVRNQTLPAHLIETVIVDDGSTDGPSLQLLDALISQGEHVVRRPNGGLSAARNTGIRAARGRYVQTLDADDILNPTYLEKCLRVMEKDPDLAVVSTPVRMFVDSLDVQMGGWIPMGLDRELLPFINVGATASSFFRRDVLLEVGGYDEYVVSYEDWDIWCTLAQRGYRASIIPEFLFHYRVRPDGIYRQHCMPNHGQFKSYLLHKHPGLARSFDLSMRLQVAESREKDDRIAYLESELNAARARADALAAGADPAAGGHGNGLVHPDSARLMAQQLIDENIRYRLVDRVNNALKSTGIQKPIKVVTSKALRIAKRK